MTDTPGAVIRHHLMPFGCRLVIPPSFQTQIWIAFFCHSSSIDEADMPPNDDDFHSRAIPPATHHSTRPNCIQMTVIFIWWSIHRRSRGRGLSCRSSSFHETKLHPNDGHFHLVVNPSATKGRGPRHSTRQICHRMTTIFIPGQFHRQPTGGVPFVVPRHSTRPNCIKMTTIFIPRQFHRRPTGGPIGHQTTAIFIPRQFLVTTGTLFF